MKRNRAKARRIFRQRPKASRPTPATHGVSSSAMENDQPKRLPKYAKVRAPCRHEKSCEPTGLRTIICRQCRHRSSYATVDYAKELAHPSLCPHCGRGDTLEFVQQVFSSGLVVFVNQGMKATYKHLVQKWRNG